jgi:tRNA pseudouridine55 synthase
MFFMDGILLIDKPEGWTSFDVVNRVRNIVKSQVKGKFRVGHTGTLDPLASGLLVLVLGKYTKRASDYAKLGKEYEVKMCLGQTSTTGDEEGIKKYLSREQPTATEIKKIMMDYKGSIIQTPPIYSAIKINGKRAYKLARQGKKPDLEPRKVQILSLEVTAYQYPMVLFTANVSSGTYIRSLVEDIGKDLGVGAYTAGLRRTKVGKYCLKDALRVEQLSESTIQEHIIIG